MPCDVYDKTPNRIVDFYEASVIESTRSFFTARRYLCKRDVLYVHFVVLDSGFLRVRDFTVGHRARFADAQCCSMGLRNEFFAKAHVGLPICLK